MFSSSKASQNYRHSIWQISNYYRMALLRQLIPTLRLASNSSILDVGAGDFTFSTFLSNEFDYKVTACEPRFMGDSSQFEFEILNCSLDDLMGTSKN